MGRILMRIMFSAILLDCGGSATQRASSVICNAIMSDNFTQETWQISQAGQILVTVTFGSVVVTGIVGNLLVIGLVLFLRHMRTSVNLCLVSLALSDLIVVVFLPTLPITYLYNIDQAFLGKYFCILIWSIDRGPVVCSVLTFLLIGVERYTVLCYPLRSLGMWKPRRACLLLVFIWTIAVGASVPYGYVTNYEQCGTENSTKMCCNLYPTPWFDQYETVLICVSFFLPIPVLVFLYGKMIITLKTQVPQNDTQCDATGTGRKTRSQVIVMLAILVILFIVCLMPFNVMIMWYIHAETSFSALGDEVAFGLEWLFRIMLYINHIANPVVYFLMSANFRQAFRHVFCRCRRTQEDQWSTSGVSLSRR